MNLSWMAWTWPTAAFFGAIFLMLAGMAAWEYFSPGGNPRVGVLQIDDELPVIETKMIELGHTGSEAAVSGEGQSLPRDFFRIGVDCGLVFGPPQAIALDLGGLGDRRVRKARHVQAERARRFRHVRIQRQIDLHPRHDFGVLGAPTTEWLRSLLIVHRR